MTSNMTVTKLTESRLRREKQLNAAVETTNTASVAVTVAKAAVRAAVRAAEAQAALSAADAAEKAAESVDFEVTTAMASIDVDGELKESLIKIRHAAEAAIEAAHVATMAAARIADATREEAEAAEDAIYDAIMEVCSVAAEKTQELVDLYEKPQRGVQDAESTPQLHKKGIN